MECFPPLKDIRGNQGELSCRTYLSKRRRQKMKTSTRAVTFLRAKAKAHVGTRKEGRGHSHMMFALRGREGGFAQKQTIFLIGYVSGTGTRGSGSKNPKFLRTSYVNGPPMRCSFLLCHCIDEMTDSASAVVVVVIVPP